MIFARKWASASSEEPFRCLDANQPIAGMFTTKFIHIEYVLNLLFISIFFLTRTTIASDQ